jgi:predicted pyridoxine 5'-phosphate oxidase superfamily flavin-nucleotide-binding protein
MNMNENVKALLNSSMWDLATCSEAGEPNVVPVAFKEITEDGKLAIGDVFLETTLKNIENNGKIAVSVYNPEKLEGYQIKGTASYVAEGDIVNKFKGIVENMFKGAATAKGALIITPEKIIVTTPGADNKKEL